MSATPTPSLPLLPGFTLRTRNLHSAPPIACIDAALPPVLSPPLLAFTPAHTPRPIHFAPPPRPPPSQPSPFSPTVLDGAYFGSTFPHLLLMQYPALVPPANGQLPGFCPRIFGYKIHKTAACRRRIEEEEAKRGDENASAADVRDENKRLRDRIAVLERAAESGGAGGDSVDGGKRQ